MAPRTPDRLEIAHLLRETRALLDLTPGNRFRARAYEAGAEALESTTADLGTLVREKRLQEIAGIGAGLAAVITEIHETGTSKILEELRAQVQPGTAELSRVPGMTTRRLATIQSKLGIASVADLKTACERGLLRDLPGFGSKTEQKLLEGIRIHEDAGGASLLPHALEVGESLRGFARGLPGVVAAEISGALRRFEELVPEIDLVVASADPGATLEAMARFPAVAAVESKGPEDAQLRLADGLRAKITSVRPADFCAALHRTTGSERHLERLAALEARRPLSPASSPRDAAMPCRGEERARYAALGLPFIPPELREDAGEIEAALEGETFEDLVAIEDVQGMVHCHTTHSDGRNTVEEMARAAHELGMKYITITDHSPTASYAGGLAASDLPSQWEEIEAARAKIPITIFRGTESDILADGSLDYPLDLLEKLDVVIASIHTRHKMDEDAMTRRLVDAMRQPVFKIWGHALGRLLRRRDPIPCRVEEVLDAIAESRAAIEINGDPHRLDLEPRWVREARKRKIRFVISTDAHSVGELRNLRYGVAMARRGGVRRQEVLNALDAGAFARAVAPK